MEKTIVAICILLGCGILIIYNGNKKKNINSVVVGKVVDKVTQHKRVSQLRIEFQVNNVTYYSDFAPSENAYSLIEKGFPFMVEYYSKKPDINRVTPSLVDSSFYFSSTLRVGVINEIIEKTKWNSIVDRESYSEIYFSYIYEGQEYSNVNFSKIDLQGSTGKKYYVYVNQTNPHIGMINLKKPFNEQDMINAIEELDSKFNYNEETQRARDTVINGDSIQIIYLGRH